MLCENKPFLNYDQQLDRLREKGISCHKPNEKKYLIRKGYFNLVNGYKMPFITGVKGNDEHQYIEGTSIEKLYKVLKFDRRLSGMLLKNITHIEEELRTICSHKFDSLNLGECRNWDDVNSYDARVSIEKRNRLIAKINNEINIAKENGNDYISHYQNKYEVIPTWVMTKVIKFTTFISMIELSKKELRVHICNLYGIEHKSRNNDFKYLFASLNWMRKTRNACAHNERIIFLKDSSKVAITQYHKQLTFAYNTRRNKQIVDLLLYLKYFNTQQEYNKLINFVIKELKDMEMVVGSYSYNRIRSSLGIRDIGHLRLIQKLEKKIPYLNLQ